MDESHHLPVPAQQELQIAINATHKRIAGQLAKSSQKIYANDISVFQQWMIANSITLHTLSGDDVAEYRFYLANRYAQATAARMFSVMHRLLEVAVQRKEIPSNPAQGIKGFKAAHDETPHVALTQEEARQLLAVVDRKTLIGKRDYALIVLLLRTGIRRFEAAALNLEDIQKDRGHTILVIKHGKGDKRRKVKLPVDVLRVLHHYLEEIAPREENAPIFIALRRNQGKRLSTRAIEYIIKQYAHMAFPDINLTPHGLRATFATLAFEGHAPLHKVQYAMGHADPRTTEHYQKRKDDMDDNAVDYIKGI